MIYADIKMNGVDNFEMSIIASFQSQNCLPCGVINHLVD